MKKLLLIVLSMFSIFLAGCDLPSSESVIEHNDACVAIHDQAIDSYINLWDLMRVTSLDAESLNYVEEKRVETLADINEDKAELLKLDGYKGDTTLRNGFIADVDVMLDLIDDEFENLIALWSAWVDQDEITDEDTTKEGEILDAIDTIVTESDAEFAAMQQAFADQYGYELAE